MAMGNRVVAKIKIREISSLVLAVQLFNRSHDRDMAIGIRESLYLHVRGHLP